MQYLRSSWKGLVFFLGAFVFNALLWLSSDPILAQPIESTAVQIVGSTVLLGFTLVFLLATKNRFVNWLFGGLEHVYATHRWLAVGALALVFVHAQTANLIVLYFRDAPFDAASAGVWARNLFIALIVLALLAKYMNYERWRLFHRFMVVPYLLAFYHAFALSSYNLLSFTPLGVWTMALGVVGVASSVYMIALYRKTAFKHKGKVASKTFPTEGVVEIALDLQAPLEFKTGQFVFFKVDKPPFDGVPHPFSVSGVDGKRVYFTIKALGDYTEALHDKLEEGDAVTLTGAFGHMTFDDYPSPQVWLAGGIGITPFLSHLRSRETFDKKITLYYSVRNKDEAVHLEFFKALDRQHENFHFVLSESDTDGFLSVDDLDLSDNPHVMLCGPVPMAKALKKQFKKTDAHRSLTYEAFSFTGTLVPDLVGFFRRVIRRFA